jgi:predicted O-methyltransferase YrrM
LPARLRSLLTFGLSDLITAVHARLGELSSEVAALRFEAAEQRRAATARLLKIEEDIGTLRTLVRARDDRAQQKLKAGLSSAVNMMAILPQLNITGVIPPFPHQGFEITGEEAAALFHLVQRQRPKLIMELGGGSSTILFAAALRALNVGRLISVEHDAEHSRRTAQLLSQAGLSDWVELVTVPLTEHLIGDQTFHWYGLNPLLARLRERIDLLFVDGPPGKMQSLSRYPALPVLAPHLAPTALVFVDDGGREDEQRMLELWREVENVAFTAETLEFLPRAPVLLTVTAKESRVARLRRGKVRRAETSRESVEVISSGRRSGMS